MRYSRQPRDRPLSVWLALGLTLGAAGCSSGQPGTQAPVQEADKQAAQKSAELRKEEMQKRAMQPRSKRQGNRD